MAKYENITVNLIGRDGNAMGILATVKKALARGGVSNEEQEAFMDDAMSGDYNHLLAVVLAWVNVE